MTFTEQLHAGFSRRSFIAAGLAVPVALRWRPTLGKQLEAVWTQLETPESIPPRWDHVLVGNDAAAELVVFGGRDANGAALSDTWLYDSANATWTQVEGGGPEPRFGSAIAADPSTQSAILFGGENESTFFDDTWRFDFATHSWSIVDTGDGPRPSPRYGLSGAISANREFIVSHGFTFTGRFDDTWSLDLNSLRWNDISPAPESRPLPRCLHEIAYDEIENQILLFGGCSSGYGPCPQGDVWSLNLAVTEWADRTVTEGPSARSNPALVRLPSSDRFVLFGGLTDAGRSGELWVATRGQEAWDWSEILPLADQPTGRSSHDMATIGNDIYLFAGSSDAGPINDFWILRID